MTSIVRVEATNKAVLAIIADYRENNRLNHITEYVIYPHEERSLCVHKHAQIIAIKELEEEALEFLSKRS